MLRAARALLLFWSVFASYGWQWLLCKLFPGRFARRWTPVHQRNATRLANGFVTLRGVFIKLGQVISVLGTFLPKAYGQCLERLQDGVPPRPFAAIEQRLEEAFGPNPLGRFRDFERTPIAAASLAQVHRATTQTGEVVAVKILYPGIERLIRWDMRVLRSTLPVLRRLIVMNRFERVLEQLSAMLEHETDFQNERANIERMRQIFADRPDVVVPTVYPELTAKGVLTMSFEEGIKINDLRALEARHIDTEAVARLLVESYFSMLLEHGVFHADPHPGNFLARPGPRLVILDYGAVEPVTPALSEGMRTVVMGGLLRDPTKVLEGMERMGFVAEGGDRELLTRVGHEYLRVLGDLKISNFARIDRDTVEKLSGFEQVRGQLRQIMRSVEYPEGFFYVERTLVLLFGLVGQLAPKSGLPGIAAPLASKALLKELSQSAASSSASLRSRM